MDVLYTIVIISPPLFLLNGLLSWREQTSKPHVLGAHFATFDDRQSLWPPLAPFPSGRSMSVSSACAFTTRLSELLIETRVTNVYAFLAFSLVRAEITCGLWLFCGMVQICSICLAPLPSLFFYTSIGPLASLYMCTFERTCGCDDLSHALLCCHAKQI